MKFSTTFRGYSKTEVDKYIADLEQKESNLRNAQKQHIDELADENFALRRKLQGYVSNEQAIAQSLVDANNLAKEVQGNAQKFAEVTLERAKVFYVAWNAYAKTLVATLSDEEVKRFNELKDKVERTINAYEGANVASYADRIMSEMRVHSHLSRPPQSAAQQPSSTSDAPQDAADAFAKLGAFSQGVAQQQGATAQENAFSNEDAPQKNGATPNATQTDDTAPTQREIDAQLKPLTAATETPSDASRRAVDRLTNPIDKVQKAAGQAIDLRELLRPDESLADLCRDLGLNVDENADK